MEVIYTKQSKKFLASRTKKDAEKLTTAIANLSLKSSDVTRLIGGKNDGNYRLRIEHYRVIFRVEAINTITVLVMNTKTNMKFRKYGYFSGV